VEGPKSIESKRLTKREVRGIRRNLFVFAFFLFISFIFWYLNSLGKDLEAEIRYPVRYISIPKGMVLSQELPEKLYLNLMGPGYSIFKLKYSGNRTPAIIDISKVGYRRVKSSSGSGYFLVTSGLVKNLSSQLKTECKILSIKPDTLFFSFEKAVSTIK
jgi:hypothetical protein